MPATPAPEHKWLKNLLGTWEYESVCPAGPDSPELRATGTDTARMLGDFWIISENTGTMPGGAGTMTAILTLGYDPARGAFVGSWVCSSMTQQFTYEGELDESARTLYLNTTGPDFTDPSKTARYRDIFELVSDTERVFRSEVLTDDGWVEMMRSTQRRTS